MGSSSRNRTDQRTSNSSMVVDDDSFNDYSQFTDNSSTEIDSSFTDNSEYFNDQSFVDQSSTSIDSSFTDASQSTSNVDNSFTDNSVTTYIDAGAVQAGRDVSMAAIHSNENVLTTISTQLGNAFEDFTLNTAKATDSALSVAASVAQNDNTEAIQKVFKYSAIAAAVVFGVTGVTKVLKGN